MTARAPDPLTYDRQTGLLDGANGLERAAALAMRLGARVTAPMHYRGLSVGCRVLGTMLAERDIVVRLSDDSLFSFPYSDPYWTRLLDRGMTYEPEVDFLLRAVADIDYSFVDCGANFGFWSILVTGRDYGSHESVAIEPSGKNAARLRANARLNGDRFTILNRAISSTDGGTTRLTGSKHEGMTIAGDGKGEGEEVGLVSLDGLLDRGLVRPGRPLVVKLDVEGVEVEAMKGGGRLLAGDAVLICEEHGLDPTHRVTRYLLEETPWSVFGLDTKTGSMVRISDLATLAPLQAGAAVGYNVFAATSPFWEKRLEAARPAARH